MVRDLIQSLAVALDPDCQDNHCEEHDLPKLKTDIDNAVALQKDAAHDTKKMREWKNFADHLGPARHAAERKHETGEQDRWKKYEERHLHGLQLVFRDG